LFKVLHIVVDGTTKKIHFGLNMSSDHPAVLLTQDPNPADTYANPASAGLYPEVQDDLVNDDLFTSDDAARTWKRRFKSLFGAVADGACVIASKAAEAAEAAGEVLEPAIESLRTIAVNAWSGPSA
jgi:hypothetical protein